MSNDDEKIYERPSEYISSPNEHAKRHTISSFPFRMFRRPHKISDPF